MPKSFRNVLEALFPSLTKKMAVAVIGVSLVAGSAFVLFAQKTGYAMLEQISYTKAHGILEKIHEVFSRDIDMKDRKKLQQILTLITNSSDIVNAFIVTEDGTVLFSPITKEGGALFARSEFQEMPEFPDEKHLGKKEGERYYEYISSPVTQENGTAAVRVYLVLKIAVDDVRAIALNHRTYNIIMTVSTFTGLAIIIYFAMSFLVIRPILKLHGLIKKIEENVHELESGEKPHFPYLPETADKDEIADLCRDFNAMIRRLNDANSKLFDAHLKQLEHADRLGALGEMAASMAHEIKNPIAGVIGALQVFQSETKENDPQKEILDEMKIQLERVNHAVNDLLSYARPRSPQMEEVSVNELLRKTLALLSPQLPGKNIAIQTNFDSTDPMILADRKQFQQVLWNIMLNAVQAMDTSGKLTICSGREGSTVRIVISDNGPGIPKENLRTVFKPFFTTKHKGTGLGMTISRNIINQHGGEIELESGDGKGVIVTITLPQAQSVKG